MHKNKHVCTINKETQRGPATFMCVYLCMRVNDSDRHIAQKEAETHRERKTQLLT